MTNSALDELFAITGDSDLAEVGGGHNQKGTEFQKHWAVLRMFELESAGEKDFLFLFEAIQDVAVLDSETAPVSICLYQVKKKDRKEWTWAELTSLGYPTKPKAANAAKTGKAAKAAESPPPAVANDIAKPVHPIVKSPLGKLYAAVLAFKQLKASGAFVSNAGCDLPLSDDNNAATSLNATLADLSASHLELLCNGLQVFHAQGEDILDVSSIGLQKTVMSPADPATHLIGAVHKFLEGRSPRHAGQARALVDFLIARISPLGARTESCGSFDEVRQRHGYSRAEFVSALAELEEIPDVVAQLEDWLIEAASEGMSMRERSAIRMAATGIYRRQVMGAPSEAEESLAGRCDNWLETLPEEGGICDLLNQGYLEFKDEYPGMRKPEIMAHIAIRAIKRCVDPI
jgi:hypothetical protein